MRLAEAAALCGLIALVLRSDRLERRGGLVALSIAVGGFVLSLLLITGGIDDLITRNVITLWMPAAVAVAGGLAARRARTLGVICTVVLCAVGLTGAIAVAADRTFQRPDWRGVARYWDRGRRAEPARSSSSATATCCPCRSTCPA